MELNIPTLTIESRNENFVVCSVTNIADYTLAVDKFEQLGSIHFVSRRKMKDFGSRG